MHEELFVAVEIRVRHPRRQLPVLGEVGNAEGEVGKDVAVQVPEPRPGLEPALVEVPCVLVRELGGQSPVGRDDPPLRMADDLQLRAADQQVEIPLRGTGELVERR